MRTVHLALVACAILGSGCTIRMGGIPSDIVDHARKSNVSFVGLRSSGYGTVIQDSPCLILTVSHLAPLVNGGLVAGHGDSAFASAIYRRPKEWSDFIPIAPIDKPDIMLLEATGYTARAEATLGSAERGDRVFAFAPFGGISGGTVTHSSIRHNKHAWGLADLWAWPGMSGSGLYRARDGALVGVIVAVTKHGALYVPTDTAIRLLHEHVDNLRGSFGCASSPHLSIALIFSMIGQIVTSSPA